jgi:hypothetical protein
VVNGATLGRLARSYSPAVLITVSTASGRTVHNDGGNPQSDSRRSPSRRSMVRSRAKSRRPERVTISAPEAKLPQDRPLREAKSA